MGSHAERSVERLVVLRLWYTGVFRECAIGKTYLKEELGKVIDEWGWKGSVDELLRYWLSKGTEIEEEVLKYIKAVKAQGVRCYLATDQEKYRGEYLQRTFGNGNPFEQVFFSVLSVLGARTPALIASQIPRRLGHGRLLLLVSRRSPKPVFGLFCSIKKREESSLFFKKSQGNT